MVSAYGKKDLVELLLRYKADINLSSGLVRCTLSHACLYTLMATGKKVSRDVDVSPDNVMVRP